MAITSLEELQTVAKSEKLKSEMSKQLTNYNIFAKECEMIAKAEKLDIKDNSWIDKAKLWSSIKWKTAMDKSETNISEMLIFGTIMGIVDIIKNKSYNKSANDEICDIATKLEEMQEENLQNLKPFLGE